MDASAGGTAGDSCSPLQSTGADGEEAGRLCAVMLTETEVANGFVKDGSSLPYIFETNESGNRKRSSKILPVCGMCGKKFVCVTTMKRHLVTHTGEKPFSCKVCGKQYTQKGNLRVHERTHRNDRPFECNICHQKFYRKEPMQKHQWRQHGIVHFKSRPGNTAANNNINNNHQPTISVIGAEGILYNSLNERIKEGNNGGLTHTEVQFEEASIAYVLEPEDVPKATTDNTVADVNQPPSASVEEGRQHLLEPEKVEIPEVFEETVVHTTEVVDTEDTHKPIKLKMKLAQAYMREIEENREREELQGRGRDGRDWTVEPVRTSLHRIDYSIGDIRLSSSDSNSNSSPDSNPNSRPQSRVPDTGLDHRQPEQPQQAENREHNEHSEKESLEFLCKACGSKCMVSDPYSFRCSNCSLKYTSLPTHMIADPLQCIGCVEIFPHKPALKQHQSSEDKERPFKCCRCGFEFRQKAHLQKHQWRIHRKKFESDPNVRDAEALLTAVDDITTKPTSAVLVSTAAELKKHQGPSADLSYRSVIEMEPTPLDLSPAKMYGTAGSITKWVEQVETARTPIIPDISIHKKPAPPAPMSRFKELLSRPVQLEQQKEQVQLHIINSLSGGRSETLTIRLVDDGVRSHEQHQPYAVKSKIPAAVGSNQSWKNIEQAENPLLNQIMSSELSTVYAEEASGTPPPMYISRASKRPRTEARGELDPSSSLSMSESPSAADLSRQSSLLEVEPPLEIRTPLTLSTTTPLRLETQYSTVSPPLNLSNAPQVSPYDYRIGKSSMISGHFQRLKSQDERSGI